MASAATDSQAWYLCVCHTGHTVSRVLQTCKGVGGPHVEAAALGSLRSVWCQCSQSSSRKRVISKAFNVCGIDTWRYGAAQFNRAQNVHHGRAWHTLTCRKERGTRARYKSTVQEHSTRAQHSTTQLLTARQVQHQTYDDVYHNSTA